MNRGAVAIVDALGFKGVWGTSQRPSTSVLESLRKVGASARADAMSAAATLAPRNLPPLLRKVLKNAFVKVVQLSDTIVVASGYRPRERALRKSDLSKWKAEYDLEMSVVEDIFDTQLRELVCSCVCQIVKTASLCDPALIYRGVVSAGLFAIDENFIIGPAVDEAAELMDLADGAFVWLAPSAMSVGTKFTREVLDEDTLDAWRRMAIRYRVPLKGGQKIRTWALNPFFHCTPADRKKVERGILRRMDSSRLEVVIKKYNTKDFFDRIAGAESLEKFRKKEREKGAKAT